MLQRDTELEMMEDIKDRAGRVNLSINHVTQPERRFKAFWEYMRSKATQVTADRRYAELEKELAAVLKDTLGGLQNLDSFLDAVESLSVTSLHVFTPENQMLHLPEGISPEDVQLVITTARIICPHLLEFKRDASVFFLPKLKNVEVLLYQLKKYRKTTQNICGMLEKSSLHYFSMEMNNESLMDLDVDLSEDDVQMMLSQINELDEIRMNQSFRTVFLFQGQCSCFITEFQKRTPGMRQSLKDLEENAVQLNRMNKGAKISSVAGSSVGAAGGVLSIIGFALIPVTAGASLTLILTGLGLGITSGVNSAVTTATEIGVNHKHQKKACEIFQSFMEDVQILQDCLEQVTRRETSKASGVVLGVGTVLYKSATIGKGIDSLVDTASALKMLKVDELAVSAGKVTLQEGKAIRNVPKLAADIPDIGQAALKGPLAFSKSARAGFIALNALFLGLDVFFICKDSISLAKGCETEVSQLIRARSAVWRSEMDSWQKIHDFLCKGLPTSEENEAVLEKPFYPEREMKKETGMNFSFDEVDEKKKKKKNEKKVAYVMQ
ncbi:apolipoprotein L1 isoform X2 [Cyclopterus lumpus]|nr:apolipoprotein L1 isoform X2 [Cyclopterus lumpus]